MHFKQAIFAVAAVLAPLATAAGNTILDNKCDHDVYAWLVGPGGFNENHTIASNTTWSEGYQSSPQGGFAIETSPDSNALQNNGPFTIFAYTVDGGTVWYNLADYRGHPFSGTNLRIDPEPTKSCASVSYPNGEVPENGNTYSCASENSLRFSFCA